VPSPVRVRALGLVAAACLIALVTTESALSTRLDSPVTVAARSLPKTVSGCEQAFRKGSRGRSRCFDQVPGANCSHPLEVEKTNPNTRGADQRYISVTLKEVADPHLIEQALQYWSWKPKTSNVAICPFPIGAVYKTALLYRPLPNGEVEVEEYDFHNLPLHTTAAGGSWVHRDYAQPVTSFYLAVRGYFTRQPWRRNR
jgi:hypothetical protein